MGIRICSKIRKEEAERIELILSLNQVAVIEIVIIVLKMHCDRAHFIGIHSSSMNSLKFSSGIVDFVWLAFDCFA